MSKGDLLIAEPVLSSGEVTPTPCNDEFGVVKMAGRMEIINANEISMAKFLGSGGYGEVRDAYAPALSVAHPTLSVVPEAVRASEELSDVCTCHIEQAKCHISI